MAVNVPEDICNLALSHLGNYGTISNITTTTNDKEVTFAIWYDITRQGLLKTVMPNFALSRRLVSEATGITIPFGHDNAFEYPMDCLKVLGLGNVDERTDFEYTIEEIGGKLYILTDDDWTAGMELRFIRDVTNVNSMSPEFKLLLSWQLAANVALDITQDPNKAAYIEKMLPIKMAELSAVNAQENRPIRVSNSRFQAARYSTLSRNQTKK